MIRAHLLNNSAVRGMEAPTALTLRGNASMIIYYIRKPTAICRNDSKKSGEDNRKTSFC